MKIVRRFAVGLVLAAAFIVLGSCAELALPEAQSNPDAPAAVTASLESAPPDSQVEVIVNIAPTPTPAPTRVPTSTPAPLPTLVPQPATVSRSLDKACDQHGLVSEGKFPSVVFGHPQTYLIYLPPCYDADGNTTRYPVIYLFHGWPFDERHWINLGVDQAADRLITSGDLPPFIIVLPRGDIDGIYNHTSGGDKSWEGVVVNELIPYIDANYRTLAQRDDRAIGGISRGGVWSLEIAFRHPDLFSSVGAHSAALGVNDADAGVDPLNLVTTAPIDTLRIYLDSGTSDWTRDTTAQIAKQLDARHIPYTFILSPGDHLDSYWSSQVEAYLRFYAAPWKIEKVVQAQLAAQTP